MRRILLAAAAMMLAAPAFAETRTFPLKDFTGIDVSTGFEVEFVQGPFSVTIDSKTNEFDRIIVEKDGNTLRVSRPKGLKWEGRQWENTKDVVRISAPNISAISLATGVSFKASALKAPSLSIETRAGVDAHISGLKVDALSVTAQSGSTLLISGECGKLNASSRAGSSLHADSLKCGTVEANAQGGASAGVFARDTAAANANGASSIRVAGKPKSLTQHADRVSSVIVVD